MTTLAGARAELVAAYVAASIRATSTPGGEPPYVLVAGGGISDVTHIVRGQAPATFRSIMLAGGFEDAASAAELDALKLAVLTVLRALPGWSVGTLGSDGERAISGGNYLSAEWSASRMIDI